MRKEWLEKDYYATLGVAKDASHSEIKKAFRALARTSHPDNNPGDPTAEARFKEINEAYETIGDEETRKEYDHAREMGYFVGGPGGGQQYVRVDDLFGGRAGSAQDLFGGFQDLFSGGRSRPRQGADATGSLNLSFHEALEGATRQLTVNGAQVKVKIPKGIASGTRVRVPGKGGQGYNGGPPGDLYVEVSVGTHPIFRRVGKRDLAIEVPVSYPEAALGATIAIPTLDGSTKIKVPAGTASGTALKLSGKGVKTSKGTGDLLVTLAIAVNPDPDAEERQALAALRSAQSDWDPRARLGVTS
ncbi:MAG: DnaJ C-terminal domain-containing protein [Acidimicrobiia bacterium]